MASCILTDNNRVAAWSLGDLFDNPIKNPEVIIDNPDEPLDNFLYADGILVISPDEERIRKERIAELKKNLSDTDYFAAQIMEEFVDIFDDEPKTLIDVIKVIVAMIKWSSSARIKFGTMIAMRIAWRKEIERLENGGDR